MAKHKNQLKNAVCTRCGKCCILPNGKDCIHLLRIDSSRTYCRIYSRRIGAYCGISDGKRYICTMIGLYVECKNKTLL